MSLETILTIIFSVIGGTVLSTWGTIIASRNAKKSANDSDRTYQSEQFKEAVDRQLDVHKEEVKIATDKLNDAIQQIEKDKDEMSKLRKQLHDMRIEYEKKIASLKAEIRYLKNKLNWKKENK